MTRYNGSSFDYFRDVVVDIFSAAVTFKSSHQTILDNLNERVWKTKAYSRLTNYDKGMLRGRTDATFDTILRYHIEWRLWSVTQQKHVNPSTVEWSDIDVTVEGKHFWKDSDRVYY